VVLLRLTGLIVNLFPHQEKSAPFAILDEAFHTPYQHIVIGDDHRIQIALQGCWAIRVWL
jgi:hypothetical protein